MWSNLSSTPPAGFVYHTPLYAINTSRGVLSGSRKCPVNAPSASLSLDKKANPSFNRRQAIRGFANALVLAVAGSMSERIDCFHTSEAIAAEKPTLTKMEKALVPVVMCRTAMTPVRRYIEDGLWDKARTNVNYCTKNLSLKKRIRDTAENGLEGDAFYDALGIAGSLDNTMTQLDASVYTPIFVASDEGISEEQLIYQEQARGFYNDALDMLDRFLSSIGVDSLTKAQEAAKLEKFEIRIEKE